MSDQENIQEPKQQELNLDELEAKVASLEEKKKLFQLDENSKRLKKIEERLKALQESDQIESVRNTFDNALSTEQRWDDLHKRIGTREQRIEAIEKDLCEKLDDLRVLLKNDHYQQYFFSSINTSHEDEKLRRFCFHAFRMTNDEFMKKYKTFILDNKFL